MSILTVSVLVSVLVLLIFGFVYSLRITKKIELEDAIKSGYSIKDEFQMSDSAFGKFYANTVSNRISGNTIIRLAAIFSVDLYVLQERIKTAGMEKNISAIEIVAMKALGVIGGVVVGLGGIASKNMFVAVAGLIIFLALFLLPEGKIEDAIKQREEDIILELPRFIEQVFLCVEAGASLQNSLITVSRGSDGIVGNLVLKAMRNGEITGDWGKELLSATMEYGVDALEEFVNDILIAYDKGTSISGILKEEVKHINAIKKSKDRERISKLTTSTLLPMTFFFLLPMMLIVLLPMILQVMEMTQ